MEEEVASRSKQMCLEFDAHDKRRPHLSQEKTRTTYNFGRLLGDWLFRRRFLSKRIGLKWRPCPYAVAIYD